MRFSARTLVAALSLVTCALPVPASDELVLTARPGLCILKDPDTQECVMGVALSWQGPAGNYCLHQSGVAEPLACWTGQSAGQLQSRLASEDDVAYWLQVPPSDEHLAQILVRVVSLAQRRPERRRRRHAWTPL